jgi:hypothetical protein
LLLQQLLFLFRLFSSVPVGPLLVVIRLECHSISCLQNTLSQAGAMPMRVFSISEGGFSVWSGELIAKVHCLSGFVRISNNVATIFRPCAVDPAADLGKRRET